MFSMEIVDSDAFLDLPLSAQALYFHLGMRADDDGAIANAKRVYSSIGASEKDLQLLLEKRFLLKVDGIIFIKHWKINNYIPKDRYSPTTYQDEYSKLRIKDNNSYTECIQNCIHDDIQESIHECIQDVSSDVYADKIREDKNREEENPSCAAELHETENEALETFFEELWKLYPLKKGKGQVSKAKKKVLMRIGFEQVKRCIERYVAEIKATGKEDYMQHGSTFFNSGYVDYLDENYNAVEKKPSIEKSETEVEEEELVGEDW